MVTYINGGWKIGNKHTLVKKHREAKQICSNEDEQMYIKIYATNQSETVLYYTKNIPRFLWENKTSNNSHIQKKPTLIKILLITYSGNQVFNSGSLNLPSSLQLQPSRSQRFQGHWAGTGTNTKNSIIKINPVLHYLFKTMHHVCMFKILRWTLKGVFINTHEKIVILKMHGKPIIDSCVHFRFRKAVTQFFLERSTL